jgi:O-antigen ligase
MTRRAGRSVVWLMIAAVFAVPLVAYFSGYVSFVIAVAVAALGILAVSRTRDAVLVVAAIGPITPTIHALVRAPYDGQGLFEAAVLVVLMGAAIRASLRGVALQPTVFETALLAFMLVVAASCAAQMPVLLLKSGSIDGAETLRTYVFHDYFLRWPTFIALERAVVLVEGAALAAVVARLFRAPSDACRLGGMAFLGGVAAAALNLNRLVEVALRRPPVLDSLWRAALELRLNTQYSDLNAAGSYFSMVTVLGLSRVRRVSSGGTLSVVGVLIALGGVWVTGSRVAFAATVVCGSVLLLVLTLGTPMHAALVRRMRMPVVLLLLAVFAAVVIAFPLTRHTSISYSVLTRVELVKTGFRMLAERPLFGVGIAQYYGQFERFVTPELKQMFLDALGKPVPRENAHNQFVQFGAELGLVGTATFILVLVAAFGRSALPSDRHRYGVIAALATFLVTCLAGHPLLTGVVTLSFFIVIGLAAAGARTTLPWRGRHAAAFTALALTVVVGLPFRWQLERRYADLTDVTLGLGLWQRDAEGFRFQWAGDRAALFASSQLSAVRLPLRSPDDTERRVHILLDGRMAAGVVVPAGSWVNAVVPLPPSGGAPAFRRIDLIVEGEREGPAGSQVLMVGRLGEFAR